MDLQKRRSLMASTSEYTNGTINTSSTINTSGANNTSNNYSTVQEIDPDDDTAFLRICSRLGLQHSVKGTEEPIINPAAALRDTQRAELMLQVKHMLEYYGVSFPYDLDALLEECKRVEAALEQYSTTEHQMYQHNTTENQIDPKETNPSIIEREIEAHKCLLLVRKEELERLRKESENLKRKQELQEKKRVSSSSCREIVLLAQHLGLSITHVPNGIFRDSADTEYVDEFHALFLPFVSLSVDAVNLIYAQIEFPGEQNETGRRRCILNHISYLQIQRRIRNRKKYIGSLCSRNRSIAKISHPFNLHLFYSVLELALSASSISINQVCNVLSESRTNIMQEVFALCFHSLITYNRSLDTIRLGSIGLGCIGLG